MDETLQNKQLTQVGYVIAYILIVTTFILV